ncbi:MAG: aspartate--tRNA ligase [Planctomycetes bacterium]|nr:aspartate--tRNA ligase [Planctomycetota bacterium]
MQRTHTCGDLRKTHAGQKVVLNGWVESLRDHGSLRFIDLRDRYGITQVILDVNGPYQQVLPDLRPEYVLSVQGKVRIRPDGMANPRIETGEVELVAEGCQILNPSRTPPFEIAELAAADQNEEIRLKYRYLDLRRRTVQKNIQLRYRVTRAIRNFLESEGFLDLETPFLTRSTPEGARDFLVPSRLQPGNFYALPQSPQLYKQIYMIAGFDRYYQIARCFRDEDLRADRQLEFTQVDIEMAFVKENDVISLVDRLLARVFKEILGKELRLPLPRLSYDEAMSEYGKDAPDVRFDLKLFDLTEAVKGLDYQVLKKAIAGGGSVRGLCLSGGKTLSRKEIDQGEELVKRAGAKGLLWLKLESDGPKGPFAKFLDPEALHRLRAAAQASTGDLILMVADQDRIALTSLGLLRLDLGRRLNLIDPSRSELLWVVDFPLVEWNEEEKRWAACHHPFTSPKEEHEELLSKDPGRIRARAYDIVYNGFELGGGSIRIHRQDVQQALFDVLQITKEEAQQKFGFLLDALSYGAPPHGGIALGLDRFVMLLAGAETIREVIPFPKTASGTCPMTGCPGPVSELQLRELRLRLEPGAGPAPPGGAGELVSK